MNVTFHSTKLLPPSYNPRIQKITPKLTLIFPATLFGGTARANPKWVSSQNVLRRVAGENPEKVLQTQAVMAFDEQMQVITANRKLIDPDMKTDRCLFHDSNDHSFVAKQAPPADGMVGLQRNVQGLLRAHRAVPRELELEVECRKPVSDFERR